MLIKIIDYQKVDTRKLMDVYSESNYENTDCFFPDEADKEAAVQKVEAGFLDFLKNDFFKKAEAAYWVLEIDGVYVSALRTCMIQKGLYYLEALETRPDCRRKGYGAMLLSCVADSLKENGPFRLCSCVSKKNAASLKTHEKSGFQVVSEEGYDYLNEEADDHDFGLEYLSGNCPFLHWDETVGRIQAFIFDLLLRGMWKLYAACTTKRKTSSQYRMSRRMRTICGPFKE